MDAFGGPIWSLTANPSGTHLLVSKQLFQIQTEISPVQDFFPVFWETKFESCSNYSCSWIPATPSERLELLSRMKAILLLLVFKLLIHSFICFFKENYSFLGFFFFFFKRDFVFI